MPKRLPCSVLRIFHGLAETSSEAVGIRAWADRYGLLAAAARALQRPKPVQRAPSPLALFTDARLAELNQRLAAEPFRGLALACPFTPNVFRQPSTFAALERYTSWVTDGLLPEVRKTLALLGGPSAISASTACRSAVAAVARSGFCGGRRRSVPWARCKARSARTSSIPTWLGSRKRSSAWGRARSASRRRRGIPNGPRVNVSSEHLRARQLDKATLARRVARPALPA